MRREADALALLRYEFKHLLDPLEAAALESRLARAPGCIAEPGGRIVTLYLDTSDARLCRRLVAGRGAGSRLRLRWYGDVLEPLVVERKHHRGGLVRKTRLLVAVKELPDLLAGRDPRARRLGIGRLVPEPRAVCAVAYERRIYRDATGSFRITIDRGLRAAAPHPEWLPRLVAGHLPQVAPAGGAPVVAECKHHGAPPRWITAALAPHSALRFSKLAWAWQRLRTSIRTIS
jgi:VTC domain